MALVPVDPPELTRQVAAAVRQFDKETTTALCEHLITHLRSTDDLYPEREAKRVLQHLRNNRYFDLMQQVADVLIQSGQIAPQIRRQYAQ
ncbi:MAG: hypothetical protein FJ147_22595 [Deltaproteobacteria bacterium]|nr:hypothetical protein [Deltaproteobacteria bacterium]